jgi:hypothetical protein
MQSPYAYGDLDESLYAYNGDYVSCNPRMHLGIELNPRTHSGIHLDPRMHMGICVMRSPYAYRDTICIRGLLYAYR